MYVSNVQNKSKNNFIDETGHRFIFRTYGTRKRKVYSGMSSFEEI